MADNLRGVEEQMRAIVERQQRKAATAMNIERIADSLEFIRDHMTPRFDAVELAASITGQLIREYNRRGFTDWANFLTTDGRGLIEQTVKEFLTMPL